MTEELGRLPLGELAQRLNAGTLSSVELVTACAARIEAREARSHAWAELRIEAALEAAQGLDRLRASGQCLGPLHGIPIGLKDLIEVEGWPTSFGSHSWSREPALRTATLARRLMAAGMIVLGKTEMVEFAFGSWGTNAARGTPVNASDERRARVPGGSSSGSAVAVADGMIPVALGSDTGGSVRIPASLNGVVGLKPALGTIPMDGVLPLSSTLDTVGPIARTVADAFLVDAALEGRNAPAASCRSDLKGILVGLIDPDQWGDVDTGARSAVHAAVEAARAAGAAIETVKLPLPLVDYQTRTGRIMAAEAYAELGGYVEDSSVKLDPNVRERIAVGREVTAREYLVLLNELRAGRRAAFNQIGRVDALLLPTTPCSAPEQAEVDEASIPMSRLTRFANWLDLIAFSVPSGRSASGLPIGVQVAGHRSRREELVRTAIVVESGPTQSTRPSCV